jgi:AAA domain/DnaB-like helicase N terminal domain
MKRPDDHAAGQGALRMLPYSEDAEKGVLCSLLLAPKEVADLCASRLPPDALYVPAHRIVHGVVQEFVGSDKLLTDAEGRIDFVSLKQTLVDRNQLEEIGGPEYLNELYTFVPTAINAASYVETVLEKYTLRQLILRCNRIAKQCYDHQEVELLLEDAEKEISIVRQGYLNGAQTKLTWFDAITLGACTSASLRSLEPKPRELIVGDWFRQGDLGFIYAMRGVGKSWFGMDLARAIAERRNFGPWEVHGSKKVMYLDGEMPHQDVGQRDVGLGAGLETLVYVNHEILFDKTGLVMNLADKDFQDGVLQICLATGIQVLFLDNLSSLATGVNENEGADWELVQPWLLQLRRHKISVVIIHHAGRNNQMRGHSKREDAAFWIVRLDAKASIDRSEGARFTSRFTKCRNARKTPACYEWTYEPNGEETLVKVRVAEDLDLFLQHVEDGLESATEIAEEMGCTKGWVSKLAKKAAVRGLIKVNGKKYVLTSP